jgi:hypothetical protein
MSVSTSTTIESEQSGTVSVTPKLATAGLGTGELKRMATRLNASAAFELSPLRLGTRPTFCYRAHAAFHVNSIPASCPSISPTNLQPAHESRFRIASPRVGH